MNTQPLMKMRRGLIPTSKATRCGLRKPLEKERFGVPGRIGGYRAEKTANLAYLFLPKAHQNNYGCVFFAWRHPPPSKKKNLDGKKNEILAYSSLYFFFEGFCVFHHKSGVQLVMVGFFGPKITQKSTKIGCTTRSS